MGSYIIMKIRLGPLVSLEFTGETCEEISDSLEGFEKLNQQIAALCGDLAERAYPESVEVAEEVEQEDQS